MPTTGVSGISNSQDMPSGDNGACGLSTLEYSIPLRAPSRTYFSNCNRKRWPGNRLLHYLLFLTPAGADALRRLRLAKACLRTLRR